MSDPIIQERGFGEQPKGEPQGQDLDAAQIFENHWNAIHAAVLDFACGDESARKTIRSRMVLMEPGEQCRAFAQIESMFEAFPVPNTMAQARAAFALAEMSHGFSEDNGGRLFQRASHFAENCGNISFQREAMIRRAALLHEADEGPSEFERAREIIKEALLLGSSGEPKEYIQFLRAYTLMGRCYLAEHCGAVEGKAYEVARALDSYFARHEAQIDPLLRSPLANESAEFKAVIEARVLTGDIFAQRSDFDRARECYDPLVDALDVSSALGVWGRVRVYLSYAKSLRERGGVDGIDLSEQQIEVNYLEGLRHTRDAKALIAKQGDGFEDSILHAKILFEEGAILLESGDLEAARESLIAARDLLMLEAETNPECLHLIETIVEILEICEDDLKAESKEDSAEKAEDSAGEERDWNEPDLE